MALTLRSTASFLSPVDPASKLLRAEDAPPCCVSVPAPAPSRRLRLLQAGAAASPEMARAPAPAEPEMFHGGAQQKQHGRPNGGVPVYVMLPLDTVGPGGQLGHARAVAASLMALRGAGVEGVMVDVWWGVVERDGPGRYDWEAYAELVRMVERAGLRLQAVMSFHQCGGNVGDSCNIPLPRWVLEEMSSNPDIVYTDRSGRRNPEYISLGCETLPVLKGRTPIQVYADYMRSFRDRFQDYLGNVIAEIQVGMGPCGELRYPSYPEANGTWRFPGIGEFQCYDRAASNIMITETKHNRESNKMNNHTAAVHAVVPPVEEKLLRVMDSLAPLRAPDVEELHSRWFLPDLAEGKDAARQPGSSWQRGVTPTDARRLLAEGSGVYRRPADPDGGQRRAEANSR